MSDSDQRPSWKLSTRRGRSQAPVAPHNSERSPSKLTRLFRGISETSTSQQGESSTSFGTGTRTDIQTRSLDSRRNAIILDVDPDELRIPPPRSPSVESISTSRFSIVFPPSPPPDTLQYPFKSLIDTSKTEHNILDSTYLSRSTSKRFLPRFKVGSSKSARIFSLRRKQRTVSYESNGEPLDGEEGELIDDEACFMDSFEATGKMGKPPAIRC